MAGLCNCLREMKEYRYMTRLQIITIGVIFALGGGLFAHAAEEGAVDTVTVMELFTSQSCSSCPPADKALAKWAKKDDVVALSCHVTYWNHLHWKDTLSQPFCTKKQSEYSKARGKRGSFTPELLVNGRHSSVGSRGWEVKKAVKAGDGEVLRVGVQKVAEGVRITLPELPAFGRGYSVEVLGYKPSHVQNIGSGENKDRQVAYTNSVLLQGYVEDVNGGQTLVYPLSTVPEGVEGFAVLVHTGAYGPIIAAGKTR